MYRVSAQVDMTRLHSEKYRPNSPVDLFDGHLDGAIQEGQDVVVGYGRAFDRHGEGIRAIEERGMAQKGSEGWGLATGEVTSSSRACQNAKITRAFA